MGGFLYRVNELTLYVLALVLMVGAVEAGAWLGRWHHARGTGEGEGFLSSLAGPSIGLLALMIGFTFSMSLSRFDARKDAALQEANAIGTAALRGRMLPAPYDRNVAPLFQEYLKLRIVERGFRLDTPQGIARLERSAALQEDLWKQAMAAAKADPQMVPTGLFVQALNEMIDMGETRITAGRNSVPAAVFVMLAGIAITALGFSGFETARSSRYHRIAMVITAVMIATIILLVFDLDNPQAGLISVSQQPLLDLLQTM